MDYFLITSPTLLVLNLLIWSAVLNGLIKNKVTILWFILNKPDKRKKQTVYSMQSGLQRSASLISEAPAFSPLTCTEIAVMSLC